MVTLVPDLPGDFVISQAVYSAFQHEMMTTPVRLFAESTVFTRCSTGRRRLVADGSMNMPLARYGALDLYTDGAGVYAANVFDLKTPSTIVGNAGRRVAPSEADQRRHDCSSHPVRLALPGAARSGPGRYRRRCDASRPVLPDLR